MKSSYKYILSVAALALMASPVLATETVTTKSSTVNPDGSVSYESHSVVTGTPDSVNVKTTAVTTTPVHPFYTFYYYSPSMKRIVSGADLNNDIISLWDTNNNNVIDNREYYTGALIVYEPTEYTKRTYMDIDADGIPELTKEEYTVRLTQMPEYARLNTDKKEGLTLYEFTGVGFQDADHNNDNQVSYDELKTAFYAKEGLVAKPLKENH